MNTRLGLDYNAWIEREAYQAAMDARIEIRQRFMPMEINAMTDETYAVTMDKMKDGQSWDVPGIIADVTARLLKDGDSEAAAVVDSLSFAIRDVEKLISTGPLINANTLRQAGVICSRITGSHSTPKTAT